MKLLVVSQYFYPEQFRISDVCFHLAAAGHSVTVLTGLPNYPAGNLFPGYTWDELLQRAAVSEAPAVPSASAAERSPSAARSPLRYDSALGACVEMLNGVTVIRCKLRPRLSGKKNLALNYYSFWRQASRTARRMAKQAAVTPCSDPDDFPASGPAPADEALSGFDKILVFQYSPVTMAVPAIKYRDVFRRLTGRQVPLIYYCFDLWPESIVSAGLPNHGPLYAAVRVLSTQIYKKADQILISSKNFECYFNDKLGIEGNINYLPIYAEELFSRVSCASGTDPAAPTGSGGQEGLNLLFAGNIGEMQSVETILKAALLLQNADADRQGKSAASTSPAKQAVHFHIVGDGSALQRCTELCGRLQLRNVTFHGRHALEEMPRFYAMADAFLVTLKDDPVISQTLPGKVQSYMAAGRPLIAAINGETAGVIAESHCGLVCPAEDEKALAAIISEFAAQTSGQRARCGAAARAYYEAHFSEQAFFARLEKYLTD